MDLLDPGIKTGSPALQDSLPAESYQEALKWEMRSEGAQLCTTLCDPMDCIAYQAPPSMEFSRQEYWCGLPFPSPGDLPDLGIKPRSPTLQADALPLKKFGANKMYQV